MGGILDIFGASKTAKAQKQAADKSAAASQYATDEALRYQREQDARTYADTAGVRALGNTATGKLQGLMDGSVNALDFTRATPGYQVNLDAGQRQLNASAAARGGLLSGAAAREGLRYGADYGTSVFNGERNALFQAAGLGQQGVNTGAQSGAQAANASQNALTRNADNLSSSYGQKADATAGLWGTIAGTYGKNALSKQFGSFAKGFGGF